MRVSKRWLQPVSSMRSIGAKHLCKLRQLKRIVASPLARHISDIYSGDHIKPEDLTRLAAHMPYLSRLDCKLGRATGALSTQCDFNRHFA